MLFLSSRYEQGWAVVEVRGRLDASTARQLHDCLETLFAGPRRTVRLIVDLSGLSYFGEGGLGVLVALRRPAVVLRLVCPEGAVLQVLRKAGLTRLLPEYPTLPQALAAPAHVDSGQVGGVTQCQQN